MNPGPLSTRLPGYSLADGLVGILLGLNCNFPMRHVALWFVWFLQGGKAIAKRRMDKQADNY